MKYLIDKLNADKFLSEEEWICLIEGFSPGISEYAASVADGIRKSIFGNKIYIRGLIEISNYCKNNCFYCGIRSGNKSVVRYRLTAEEIMDCCREGYRLGFRTFVMQGGEDMYFGDDLLCRIISDIKCEFPDCAVTLSLGERTKESYERLYKAGADRYLLRHEAVSAGLYKTLHPSDMSLEKRMQCLKDLKSIGYQTGCGFMVGPPRQTAADIAADLRYISEFKPHMVGIGPFISHHDTPFREYPNGSTGLTIFLLSLIRITLPNVLLPATTALATLSAEGRERGIKAGANVIMPNLSPVTARKKYELYDNKAISDGEAAEGLAELEQRMRKIGYEIVCEKGDYPI